MWIVNMYPENEKTDAISMEFICSLFACSELRVHGSRLLFCNFKIHTTKRMCEHFKLQQRVLGMTLAMLRCRRWNLNRSVNSCGNILLIYKCSIPDRRTVELRRPASSIETQSTSRVLFNVNTYASLLCLSRFSEHVLLDVCCRSRSFNLTWIDQKQMAVKCNRSSQQKRKAYNRKNAYIREPFFEFIFSCWIWVCHSNWYHMHAGHCEWEWDVWYTHLIVDIDHTVCHTICKVWSQPRRFAKVTLFAYALRLTSIAFGTLGQYRRSRRTRWPINAKSTIIRTQFDALTIDDIHVHAFRHLADTIRWDACIVCWLLLSVSVCDGMKPKKSIQVLCFPLEWVNRAESNHT